MIKYKLILEDVDHGEVIDEHTYRTYSNPRLALRMRDYMQHCINNRGFISLPECRGQFNRVYVEALWSKEDFKYWE